ncbi:MAG: tetratricopeptide repeat protein [Desulfovibrionales bacterium]
MEEKNTPSSLQDRIATETQDVHPVLKKILDNAKFIVLGVAILLLAVAGYSGYSVYQDSAKKEAAEELGRILTQTQGSDRIAALQDFLDNGRLQQEARMELARAQMDQELYQDAAATWARLAEDGRGDLAVVARLGQSKNLLLSGTPQEALTILESLRTTAPDSYHRVIDAQIAEAAEQAGNRTQALSAYERLKNAVQDEATEEYYDYKISQLKQQNG